MLGKVFGLVKGKLDKSTIVEHILKFHEFIDVDKVQGCPIEPGLWLHHNREYIVLGVSRRMGTADCDVIYFPVNGDKVALLTRDYNSFMQNFTKG